MSAPEWWQIAREGKYAETEATMLAATDRGEGYFPECEVRASYYENWGDTLSGEDQIAKYREALNYWQMHASQSTSGGEGTARMMDVHRLEKKIAKLES
ncbi:MAG: hypothetical protein QM785_04905 [Pyrinomonadaceae bacterium]